MHCLSTPDRDLNPNLPVIGGPIYCERSHHWTIDMESGIIADMSLGSEDTDGSGPHWHVERSNSSVTSMSLDSSLSPTSPVSPLEEDKGDLGGVKATDVTEDYLQGEEMSVKL
uniref:Uncharacterized protein n=2 Tax=Timema TaxID=61471 RepID=A0A7R9CIZ7_TIMPO|nr:unnamed protein product [Timema douglasi]CAD7397507.1 unnamed protein product [Timema poppensis]